ncbi:MAG TPA: flippase-like domain-containing protein [Desulfobaccales bacterium]|nr:flippase-like domain-containing protein [Desulfobaccales bacterium]
MSQFRLARLFSFDLNFLMTVLGGIFLGILVYSLGWQEVAEQITKMGPGWLSINGQMILVLLANTFAWNYAFDSRHRTVDFWSLFKMRLVGDGLNYLVPAALAGEVFRINSLRRDMPLTSGAASVTVAKLTNLFAAVLCIALGLLAAAPFAPLEPGLVPWLWLAFFACLALLVLVYKILRQRLFDKAAAWLKNWLPARMYDHLPTSLIEETDRIVADYLAVDNRAFFASVALHALGWVLSLIEVFLIFHFLELPEDPATIVMVGTLSILWDTGLFFVPIKFGVQEGGRVLIFLALGLSPAAGLSFGIIHRIKELIWASLGLLVLQTIPSPHAQGEPQ